MSLACRFTGTRQSRSTCSVGSTTESGSPADPRYQQPAGAIRRSVPERDPASAGDLDHEGLPRVERAAAPSSPASASRAGNNSSTSLTGRARSWGLLSRLGQQQPRVWQLHDRGTHRLGRLGEAIPVLTGLKPDVAHAEVLSAAYACVSRQPLAWAYALPGRRWLLGCAVGVGFLLVLAIAAWALCKYLNWPTPDWLEELGRIRP